MQEEDCKKALEAWFLAHGYYPVTLSQRNQSGWDVVAESTVLTWLIEAKGDEFGRGPAYDNSFHAAVGEVVSRIPRGPTHGINYGIALPTDSIDQGGTFSYRRVLRWFSNTPLWSALRIHLILVPSNGDEPIVVEPEIVCGFLGTELANP